MSATACRFSIILVLFPLLASTVQGQSRIAYPTPDPQIAPHRPGALRQRQAGPSSTYGTSTYGQAAGSTSGGSNLIPPPNMSGTAAAPSTTYAPGTVTPYPARSGTAVAPASPNSQPYVPPGNAYSQPGVVSPFVPTATAPPAGSYGGTLAPPSPGMDLTPRRATRRRRYWRRILISTTARRRFRWPR